MATNGREPDKREAFSGSRARCRGRDRAQTMEPARQRHVPPSTPSLPSKQGGKAMHAQALGCACNAMRIGPLGGGRAAGFAMRWPIKQIAETPRRREQLPKRTNKLPAGVHELTRRTMQAAYRMVRPHWRLEPVWIPCSDESRVFLRETPRLRVSAFCFFLPSGW
jgi:hypothetical protein